LDAKRPDAESGSPLFNAANNTLFSQVRDDAPRTVSAVALPLT